ELAERPIPNSEVPDPGVSDPGLHRTVVVGNRRLMDSQGVNVPVEFEQRLAELEQQGQSVLLVALDQALLGAIGLRDSVRMETESVLRELREAGVSQFAMLTGDRAEPARRIAEQLGIDDVRAELLPADKAKRIAELLAAGHKVAMVGDGVNDAPALATATVGLALGGVGSDLAAEAGDLVLMGDPLRPLPGLLRLSRQLVLVIRQSIFVFAFGMNAVGMLLGSLGWINPAVAAVFHEVSSLAVMLNAMRLLWFERWHETRLGRLSNVLTRIAECLVEKFSPTRLVFGFLDHWPTLLRTTAAVFGVWWCCSGLVLLSEDEQAVVTRLGRFETTLTAGSHWRWPVGLESIRRERVAEVRSIQIGFRAAPTPLTSDGLFRAPVEWMSEHADDGFEPVAPESFTLTGEEVSIEMTAEVQFRIGELRRFAFAAARPEETLRAVTESVLREVAATESLDSVLTNRRREIEAASLRRIRELIASYDIGVEVLELCLLDIHPPQQVVPAYRQVADALEQREQFINEAEGYYARKVLSAAGEQAIRVLTDSAGSSKRLPDASTTGGVTGWQLDDALWQKLTAGFDTDDRILSGEAAAKLLTARREKTRQVEAAIGSAARFNSVVKVFTDQPTLTSLHLYWTTMEKVLAARPLMILDPALRGKSHLWLTEPGQTPIRLPSPETPLQRIEMPETEK
ncbi:MAG: HAD-IC family P-type ATPase, partial [Planctomycetaceae bacterium]